MIKLNLLSTSRRTLCITGNCMHLNLVPQACDPREGTRGSGIIRCRKPGSWLRLNYASHFNGQSDSSLKRIIPEPRVPSRGSQVRGTRLHASENRYKKSSLKTKFDPVIVNFLIELQRKISFIF